MGATPPSSLMRPSRAPKLSGCLFWVVLTMEIDLVYTKYPGTIIYSAAIPIASPRCFGNGGGGAVTPLDGGSSGHHLFTKSTYVRDTSTPDPRLSRPRVPGRRVPYMDVRVHTVSERYPSHQQPANRSTRARAYTYSDCVRFLQ